MKNILVACGSGAATSTLICEKVRQIAEQQNIDVNIVQCSLGEITNYLQDIDLIVTSMRVDNDYSVPLIPAFSFLSGIGADETERLIIKHLKEEE